MDLHLLIFRLILGTAALALAAAVGWAVLKSLRRPREMRARIHPQELAEDVEALKRMPDTPAEDRPAIMRKRPRTGSPMHLSWGVKLVQWIKADWYKRGW